MNIHTHSEYSFKDAISKVEDIALRQKELGYDYFCITDHGTMAAFPDAFSIAKKHNMKFIPGIEAYLTPNEQIDEKVRIQECSEANRILKQKRASEEDKLEARAIINKWEEVDSKRNFHITLLATSQEGLNNLFRIYNEGETYYKYRVSYDSICKYKEGIIVLSGCFGGELAFYIKSKQYDKAEKLIKKYKEEFGDNYFIEIQNHGLTQHEKEAERNYLDEFQTYSRIIDLALKYNVRMIATNDSHYTRESDKKVHEIYKNICYNKTEDEKQGEQSFMGTGYHMTSAEELKERFKNAKYKIVEDMFQTPDYIASKTDNNIDIEKSKFLVDKNKELEELVWAGWERKRKGTDLEERSKKQIEWELYVIKNRNFSNYFINMKRIVDKAYENGILMGPGRGSAVGAEVDYLLDITKVDPLKYNLIFERFLNPSRNAMPDIDIDLESRMDEYNGKLGSDVTMDSLREHYKFQGRVGNVVGGSTLSLFKKLASYYEIPFSNVNKFTTTDITKVMLAEKSPPSVDEFASYLRSIGLEFDEKWQKVYEDIDVCYMLDGIPMGSSIHASGKIMTEEESLLPVNDKGVINFNMSNLDKYDFVKFDLLSLDTLNPLKKIYGIDLDWNDTSCEEAWEVLNNGDTDYVFQFQGKIPKKMLQDVHISTIDQLAEITAINRPGPLALKLHEKWIDIQNGIEEFEGEDKVLRDLLKKEFGETHSGLVIYQEDVMKIFEKGAGFTLGEADDIRRAMGKKDPSYMLEYKDQFISKWQLEGDPEKIWEKLEGFCKYAFNKSHAVAYAIISYQAAKVWALNKEVYLEWLINNTSGEKKNKALETCQKLGWKLEYPDYKEIKQSSKYKIKDGKVLVPIDFHGSFDSLSDFIFGDLSKAEKSNLSLIGIFDSITPDRFGLTSLIQAIPDAKAHMPTFPESDSILEIIENGELIGLWSIDNITDNRIDIKVNRTRSIKDVTIYRNRQSLPDSIIEYNIKQDLKRLGIIKKNQLSMFPDFDLGRSMQRYERYRDRLKENGSPYIKKNLELEFSNIIREDHFKLKLEAIEDEEYIVVFKELKTFPAYGYSKATFEFDNGLKLFYIREDAIIENLQKLNKGSVYRLNLRFDWYINKNLDPVLMFKIKDVFGGK